MNTVLYARSSSKSPLTHIRTAASISWTIETTVTISHLDPLCLCILNCVLADALAVIHEEERERRGMAVYQRLDSDTSDADVPKRHELETLDLLREELEDRVIEALQVYQPETPDVGQEAVPQQVLDGVSINTQALVDVERVQSTM